MDNGTSAHQGLRTHMTGARRSRTFPDRALPAEPHAQSAAHPRPHLDSWAWTQPRFDGRLKAERTRAHESLALISALIRQTAKP